MDISAVRDEIRIKLTGGLLDLELDDSTIDKIIASSLRELQRYICSTKLITIPYQRCIDLSKVKDGDTEIKVSSVSRVYRADGFVDAGDGKYSTTNVAVDPMYAAQWQLLSGTGNMYNFNDYVYNYAAWNTLLQIRNTSSTDMFFTYDKSANKLYINISSSQPNKVTIEYVPRYDDVSEIKSDYWIDVLVKLAVANTKVTVGRIRSRYKETGALWTQDGDEILSEGLNELNALREHLEANSQLVYPID